MKRPRPSASDQTDEITSTGKPISVFMCILCSDIYPAKPNTTKSSRKSAATKKSKPSKPPSRNVEVETDLDNQSTTSEPSKAKAKKSSAKLMSTQTDDESDDLAIKKTKVPRKVDKGEAWVVDSSLGTFESAGIDVDLYDSPTGPSNVKLPPPGKKVSRDDSLDARKTVATQVTPPAVSGEEERQRTFPLGKRGRSRNDEGEEPPRKRGKKRKSDGGEGDNPAKVKPRRRAKGSPSDQRSTTAEGKSRKKTNPLPDTSDVEGEELVQWETGSPARSNNRKRHQRKLNGGFDDEKRDGPDRDDVSLNPNRVRLDSIPPEGIVIRKKNGIVEKLLPPAMYVLFRDTGTD